MSRLEAGMKNRRAVLGDAHVDRSMQSADPLAQPLQELVTEYCWDAVWGREALPRQTRSLLTIVMLTAGGHHDELRVHVRGALRNGCTPEEVAEAITHSAIYAGVPAALSAMRIAVSVINETQKLSPVTDGTPTEKEA